MLKKNSKRVVLVILILFGVLWVYNAEKEKQAEQKRVAYLEDQKRKAAYQKVSYDPKTCSGGGDGKIYLAFDRTVLGIKIEDLFSFQFIHLIQKENAADLPVPPNPSEPEGCFDFPIQISSVGVSGLGGLYQDVDNSYALNYERELEKIVTNKRGGESICGRETKDFLVCHVFDLSPRRALITGIYKADEAIYTTPDGHPFILYCDYVPADTCHLNYLIHDGIRLRTNTNIRINPISSVISADKQLRSDFNQMLIDNYTWTDQAATHAPQ